MYFRCKVRTVRCILIIRIVCDWVFLSTCWIFVSGRTLAVVSCCYGVSVVCKCCLDCCNFKKQISRLEVFGFHCYMEICQFVCCLLSRTRHLSDLPEMHDWEAYMDMSKIESFKKIDAADFLLILVRSCSDVQLAGCARISISMPEIFTPFCPSGNQSFVFVFPERCVCVMSRTSAGG